MNEYMALTSNADDLPSLYVNTTQPLHSLLSTARYRIGAVTQILENLAMRGDITTDSVILSDFALLCCIPLRDGAMCWTSLLDAWMRNSSDVTRGAY
jgi:hypothetical protein